MQFSQFIDFSSISHALFDHQNMFAAFIILFVPACAKWSICSSFFRKVTNTSDFSSTNIKPYLCYIFSRIYVRANSYLILLIAVLIQLISQSVAVFAISVFKSSMQSNSAFLVVSSFPSLLSVTFRSKLSIRIFCASSPSVLYFRSSTFGRMSHRIMTLSSVSYCSSSGSACQSSIVSSCGLRFSSSWFRLFCSAWCSSSSGCYLPTILFNMLLSSFAISARLYLFGWEETLWVGVASPSHDTCMADF